MAPTFDVKVGRDYYRRGHFYVPKDHAHRFAGIDSLKIELPRGAAPIDAKVDRPPNADQTWILGGPQLRDWLQKQPRPGYLIRVQVQGRDRIDITLA